MKIIHLVLMLSAVSLVSACNGKDKSKDMDGNCTNSYVEKFQSVYVGQRAVEESSSQFATSAANVKANIKLNSACKVFLAEHVGVSCKLTLNDQLMLTDAQSIQNACEQAAKVVRENDLVAGPDTVITELAQIKLEITEPADFRRVAREKMDSGKSSVGRFRLLNGRLCEFGGECATLNKNNDLECMVSESKNSLDGFAAGSKIFTGAISLTRNEKPESTFVYINFLDPRLEIGCTRRGVNGMVTLNDLEKALSAIGRLTGKRKN